MPEIPPTRILLSDLRELLGWYEENLCNANIIDPRGHRVRFTPERFPYMIKLRNLAGGKLSKPKKRVDKIRAGTLTNAHFGGFDPERAQTLSWLLPTVCRPTRIVSNQHLFVPGDELYVKEFEKRGYRFKVLACVRLSPSLLVPVSSFPRSKLLREKESVLWS